MLYVQSKYLITINDEICFLNKTKINIRHNRKLGHRTIFVGHTITRDHPWHADNGMGDDRQQSSAVVLNSVIEGNVVVKFDYPEVYIGSS